MDEIMEKDLLDIRKGFEREIEEGKFPNINLDVIVDGIRRGMIDVKEGRVVGLEEFRRRIDAASLGKRGVKRSV